MTSGVTAPPRINVLDPQFYVDPWDAYRWLRDTAPIFWDPAQKLWAVSRYDDVIAIERDGQRYSSFSGSRPHIDQRADQSMINLDDPEHQAQRSLVMRRFTPRAVRDHEARVRHFVTAILDEVAVQRTCEAIEAIASRLPAMMIGELLGYPADEWERVRSWSERIMLLAGQTSPDGPPHISHPDLGPVLEEWVEITRDLVEARRAEPRDDLISLWAQTPGWDTKHILDEVILVLDGGAETTRTVIGTMIRDLALHPDQRRLLIEDPTLLATTAVEEFIRWVTPVLNMRRTATEHLEIQGQQIRAGHELLLLYGSANRDPRAFADPDVLDVRRPHNRHVAFGFGTHFCLGAHLARLEIRVMPDWQLADGDEPRIVPASFARAYDRIPIEFTPG
jgi:cholest-4-en-3-one 26-monooxygenase